MSPEQLKKASLVRAKTFLDEMGVVADKCPREFTSDGLDYPYFKKYYINQRAIGTIMSSDKELWLPNGAWGVEHYRREEQLNIPVPEEIAIVEDLFSYSIAHLWNYFDFNKSGQLRG